MATNARVASATGSCSPAPMVPPPVLTYMLVVPSISDTIVTTAASYPVSMSTP